MSITWDPTSLWSAVAVTEPSWVGGQAFVTLGMAQPKALITWFAMGMNQR